MTDPDKPLEAVAWVYRTDDEIWVALDHEDPDAISAFADETPLTDLNRANEIIREMEERARNALAALGWKLETRSGMRLKIEDNGGVGTATSNEAVMYDALMDIAGADQ